MSKKVVAAIDVGSHALRMKIGELNKSGKFKELENIRKIAVLGHDTFTKGKLSFESVDQVCDLLKLFKMSFDDYGVEHYEAMATSAIREASNRDYIIDQIRLKTGLNVEVISNSQEQFLTHKAIKEELEDYSTLINEGAVIVVVGAGSIQITTYRDGQLESSQNVKMGALRIREVFGDLEDNLLNYHKIIDEYIATNLEGVDFFNQQGEFEHLIAVGGEISIISKIIEEKYGDEIENLTKKQFNKLFKQILGMTNEEIVDTFKIKKERADIIIPSMMLFRKFIERVNNNTIITPRISLSDGIIRSIHEDFSKSRMSPENVRDVVTNARVLAAKFHYNDKHSETVENHALILFDRLKNLHGLSEERVLLQVAAILHDIGKLISLDKHYLHSYNIIKSLEIFGLSEEQMEMVANIACYHSMVKPDETHLNFVSLPRDTRAKVAKLVAIIRLADAMDRAHKSKLGIESIKLREKSLIINAVCDINIDTNLEEWTFSKKADFFVEVFGVTPTLKIKREFR